MPYLVFDFLFLIFLSIQSTLENKNHIFYYIIIKYMPTNNTDTSNYDLLNNLDKKLLTLENIRNNNTTLTAELDSSEKLNTAINIQFIMWSVIAVITIILLFLNYIAPNVISIGIIIVYSAILAFFFYFFGKGMTPFY